MTESKHFIKTGITAVPFVGWGTHICHFFKNKQELCDIIVPYIKTGLLGNEKCIWITSDPIRSNQAISELAHEVTGIDDYISSGQLLVVGYNDWYTELGEFSIDGVLRSWTEAEKKALDEGYKGLRAVGIMSWVQRENWNNIVCYEAKVDSVIRKNKMLALCCYSLSNLEAPELIEMVSNHAMVIISHKVGLMAIGNSRQAKIYLMRAQNLSYDAIGSSIGISRQRVHKIINPRKKPRVEKRDMLTSSEAASILNIHVNTLRRWGDLGVLPVYRIGSRGDRRFKRSDIHHLIN